jgi:preprotein translocase subunit SecA
MEHLENMEYLRDSVRLRAYGHQDPLVEYKNEGHKMFRQLLSMFEASIAQTIFKVSLVPKTAEAPVVSSSASRPVASQSLKKKPGRNDPCPCGKKDPVTGKSMKYKKCCWPKYG